MVAWPATTRRSGACLQFNGVDVTEFLEPYLQEVTYTDPATGDSDSLEVTLYNVDIEWLGAKYPKLGDKMSGSLPLVNWNKQGDNPDLPIGTFVIDTVSFAGGPLTCTMSGLSLPADSSIRTRERTKTWENVMLRDIAGEVAGRYGLQLFYDAPDIQIASVEQSQEADSAFLYKLAEAYGVAVKIFDWKLVLYEMGRLEDKPAVATLGRSDWVDDGWEYTDTMLGVYTGGRIGYKRGDDSEDIQLYIGFCAEADPAARTKYLNETAGSEAEARIKLAAQVNDSNREMTTISGPIWPNLKIVSGVTIEIADLGAASGKYFVDEVVFKQTGNGTEQTIKAHKCQWRL